MKYHNHKLSIIFLWALPLSNNKTIAFFLFLILFNILKKLSQRFHQLRSQHLLSLWLQPWHHSSMPPFNEMNFLFLHIYSHMCDNRRNNINNPESSRLLFVLIFSFSSSLPIAKILIPYISKDITTLRAYNSFLCYAKICKNVIERRGRRKKIKT